MIDTTDMAIGDLKRRIDSNYALDVAPGLAIFIMSFAYRRGSCDEETGFRCAAKNPHYEDELRALTGQDAPIGEFIDRDPDFAPYFGNLTRLLEPLLPRFSAEGVLSDNRGRLHGR